MRSCISGPTASPGSDMVTMVLAGHGEYLEEEEARRLGGQRSMSRSVKMTTHVQQGLRDCLRLTTAARQSGRARWSARIGSIQTPAAGIRYSSPPHDAYVSLYQRNK